MGRTTPPDEEGALASILEQPREQRDYLPIIHRRLIKLATRWVQEELKLEPEDQAEAVAAYTWMLDEMNRLIREIETQRTLSPVNSRNEEVYARLESIVQSGPRMVNLNPDIAHATFEQLGSEITAVLEELRAQE